MQVESDKAQKKSMDKLAGEIKLHDNIWPDLKSEITDIRLDSNIRGDVLSEQDLVCLYYVNENNVEACPQIHVVIGNQLCTALIDTGCQCSIISEELYSELKTKGLNSLELPTQNVVLKSAFTGRTKRVKRQALIQLRIRNISVDQIILISPQLVTPLLLGMDFCVDNRIVIDFPKETIIINTNDDESATEVNLVNGRRNMDSSIDNPTSRGINLRTAEQLFTPQRDSIINPSMSDPPTQLHNETLQDENACPDRTTAEKTARVNEDYGLLDRLVEDHGINRSKDIKVIDSSLNKYVDGSIAGSSREHSDINVIRHVEVLGSMLEDGRGADREVNRQEGLGTVVTRESNVEGLKLGENNDSLLSDELGIDERLSYEEKWALLQVVHKYREHLVERPGKCNMFEYEFQMQGELPKSCNSRPIPFSLRREVREQIEEMINNDILEISHSPYVNPLTIVQRKHKPVRICVDARQVNKQMIPDRTKTPPAHELLQRFHGAKYISSIDLNSAFLQIPLKESSRMWTAFHFEGQTFQFKRVPFGYRNSLASFIRALHLVLGSDSTEYVLHYVDDILVYSKTYDEHIKHLDIVLGKLTTAGFTININKCKFGKQEIRFLGHIISNTQVTVDPERIAAILKYPAPRNQKQLRQFLGTCNYHHRFIINYADHVAPLLGLLKKGTKWKWTAEMQLVFEKLREKFANTIHLVQPDERLPYIIYTDASARAIGAVLMQKDLEGNVNIVSTASRVMNSAEKRYTTCEQELLAVVYALEKFRVHVYGNKMVVHTDNRALSFLQKCVITSNRVARWLITIQEYDMEVRYIKGAENHLADVLSRNPAGLGINEIQELTKPNTISVNKIELKIDQAVIKDLRNLADQQRNDQRLRVLREKLEKDPNDKNHTIEGDILFRRDRREAVWKAMLPECLNTPVIQYVHASLGHAGVDKCVWEIKQSFHLKNVGREVRSFITSCDICQRVKHPNRSFEIQERSHVPSKPGELCAIDLYGPLPTGRGGVRYVLVCFDVFSKYVKLYPLKAATTRACLNKLVNHYLVEVIKPKVILSDNGTQFHSPLWKETMQKHGVEVRYSAIRHPQSNPSERCMREISKFCRIYCHSNHRKWTELIPHIEHWVNKTVASTTLYTPVELLFGAEGNNVFQNCLPKLPEGEIKHEDMQEKIAKAYERMRQRAHDRSSKRKHRNAKWNPRINDKVLVKTQPTSDAVAGVTGKFIRPYEGPYKISKLIPPSTVEVCDSNGKVKGQFNWKSIKVYKEAIV